MMQTAGGCDASTHRPIVGTLEKLMQAIDINYALVPARSSNCRYEGMAILGANGVAFGGHCAAQTLSAAADQAGGGRWPNSIHTTFLSPIALNQIISYEVTWLKEGRAFSVLRVDAWQEGLVRLSSVVSFHAAEIAPEHQISMPAASQPQVCPEWHFIPPGTNPEVRRCFDIRSVEIIAPETQQHPTQACWLKCRQPLGAPGHLHAGALVWFSDLSLPWIANLPHTEKSGTLFGASLDHSVWFHRQFSANEWLLFVQESPIYTGARALTRGMFFTATGHLVATATQETLLRAMPHSDARRSGI